MMILGIGLVVCGALLSMLADAAPPGRGNLAIGCAAMACVLTGAAIMLWPANW